MFPNHPHGEPRDLRDRSLLPSASLSPEVAVGGPGEAEYPQKPGTVRSTEGAVLNSLGWSEAEPQVVGLDSYVSPARATHSASTVLGNRPFRSRASPDQGIPEPLNPHYS